MQRALGETNKTARNIESRFERMNRNASARFVALGRSIAGALVSTAALRGAQQLIDTSTRIENSLKVAGIAGAELERVYDSLFASAQRNAAPLESLVELYGRAAQVQTELGVSSRELEGFVDNVAVALRVSGKSASEASGALLQLSQALGSGIVRAEEYNSINEGALPILQAVAAGLEEAGGSTAKLRQLVVDGKVSSEAFFRAFEAGSVILREKVANAELTLSQQFVRLQNVLIDTAGKFEDATGASEGAGAAIGRLAGIIEGVGTFFDQHQGSVRGFTTALSDLIDTIDRFDPSELREALGLGVIDDFLEGTSLLEGRFGLASQQVVSDAGEIEAAMANALAAVFGLADAASAPAELQAEFDVLIERMHDGDIGARELQDALVALGGTSIDFGGLKGLIDLTHRLREARAEAAALATQLATPRGPQGRGRPVLAGSGDGTASTSTATVTPVSLADYPVTGGSGSGGGGKGGSGKTFEEILQQQERENENLREKTALQAQLNPLVNDYGLAIEKLRVQQELENEAERAGLELTPDRIAAIEQLAEGYALAMAEAERLTVAQDALKDSAEDLGRAGRQAFDTIVDGILESRDAGEILNSVLRDLGRNLLNMGVNLIGSGFQSGGFNPLGALFGIFGFANGGIARNGKPLKTFARGGVSRDAAIFGEGPMAEAAVPLPDGRRIPVDLRLPSMPAGTAAGQALTVHVVSDDEKFGAFVTDKAGQVVAQSTPGIVGAAVGQANKSAPSAMARYQQQRQGSDYRL